MFKDLLRGLEDTKSACRSIMEERVQMYGCNALIELLIDVHVRNVATYAGCALLRQNDPGDS